jgi:O-antigen/teichoic acid export membrane protein
VLSSLSPGQSAVRRRLVLSGLGVSGGGALAGALLISIAAEFILKAYGPSFRDAAWVLRILAAAAVFDSLNDLINQTFLASGRAWLRLWANSLWAVLTVLGILLIVPRTGPRGLATVLLCTQGLHLLVQCLLYATTATTRRNDAQPTTVSEPTPLTL